MTKVSVKYHAPKGDEKVVEIFGETFFDGQPNDVDLNDRDLGKLKKNPHFEVSGGDEADDHDGEQPPEKVRGKPGRKPKQAPVETEAE